MSTIKPSSPSFVPEVARRTPEIPGVRRSASERPSQRPIADSKRLMVGRDIVLSGDITACDTLVVEGRIEATLSNSHTIEISDAGSFKGTAEIVEADISGLFDGTLTVRGRLLIRSSGKVTGTVRYGQLEVELGGEISGDIKILPAEVEAPMRESGQESESMAAASSDPAPSAPLPESVSAQSSFS